MKNKIYSSQRGTLSLIGIFAITLLMAFSAAAQTQGKTIKGTVKFSEDNTPLPGVNIYVKGNNAYGTVADSQGQFVFPRQLQAGDVLMFSSIGLKTIEYVVTAQAPESLTILMTPDTIVMVDEILVDQSTAPKASKRLRKLMK